MSIRIIKSGLLTTIQDAGRNGYRHMGIGPGGAMDPFAMAVSNFLAGNDETAAVMEINFPGPEIFFQQNAMVSITGGNLGAYLDDAALTLWKTIFVKKGSVLGFRKPVDGSKTYLAVHGGWTTEYWLGSASTHLRLAAGGHLGRALQKDDVIGFARNDLPAEISALSCSLTADETAAVYKPAQTIRCIRSVEWGLLQEDSKKRFDRISFTVGRHGDRMGYRLTGAALATEQPAEMISSAVDAGTIQLLPGGSLIVLMADHQTTGGYPRMASVIKADLPKLAQLKPGDEFRFAMLEPEEAEDALISMQQMLERIKKRCRHHFKEYVQR